MEAAEDVPEDIQSFGKLDFCYEVCIFYNDSIIRSQTAAGVPR